MRTPTHRTLTAELAALDRAIEGAERLVAQGKTTRRGELTSLYRRRQAIKLVLLHRRILAAPRVVDLEKFRCAGGALVVLGAA